MTMTLKQFASKGGKARAAKLTPERRKEIASNAGKARKTLSTTKELASKI